MLGYVKNNLFFPVSFFKKFINTQTLKECKIQLRIVFVCKYKHIVNVNMLLSGINIARSVF